MTSVAAGSVWVDARGAQSPEHSDRGIARYVAQHTLALLGKGADSLGAICLDPALPIPASLQPLAASDKLRWRPERVPRITETPPIYHVMSPFELTMEMDEIWPRVARREGVKTAVTLYDLIPLVYPERYLDPNPYTNAIYRARLGLIRRADWVFTISRNTADDAIELLGVPEDRITVIDCGVSERLPALVADRGEAKQVLERFDASPRAGFLLYVGGDEPRKNIKGLIEAFALLPEGLRRSHQLVIVCSISFERKRELTAFAEGLGIDRADLLFTGYVPDRELVALYRCCDLFVFPSEYEGAGLPILEAMSCDAPVAASGVASMPEILGNLEATFDPTDPSDIAGCLRRVLEAPGELDSLRERSRRRAAIFTWERVGRLTLEGYERAQHLSANGARPRRKRLAVLTPWPPQASGIATHSRNLVEQLASQVDVDVVVPDVAGVDFDRSLEPRVKLLDHVEFGWAAGVRDYDRLLYMLGSSQYHTDDYYTLLRRPGAVLAHDVRLQGLYFHLNRQEPDPGWLSKKALELYGDRLPKKVLKRIWEERVFVEHELYMTGEIQDHAEEVFAHSTFQERLLQAERPEDGPPVAVVPFGVPAVPPVSGEWPRGAGPLIVSAGIVSISTKRLPLLLDAFVQVVREEAPDARLLISGEVDDVERDWILSQASRLGIGDAVEVPGRADDDDYWRILLAADLAVQLRSGVVGGTPSAVVADCIAARLPTIVSDIGWLGDLPENVVAPVPAECSAGRLAEEMGSMLRDEQRRSLSAAAQELYAAENSFARVAERYVKLLEL
jgi:glycosyltransferase involved in cell wall biosynthesis